MAGSSDTEGGDGEGGVELQQQQQQQRQRRTGEMGVYDHLMRPSMGHKLQVDLKDSMERYHDTKQHLQQHFAELRFGSKDLHTSSGSSSPEPPVKKWGDPGSRFNKAPERAAHKARLAQLRQENSHLTIQQADGDEPRASNSFLPPIPDGDPHHKATPAQVAAHPKELASHTDVTTKPEASKTGSRTTKAEPSRGSKAPKKPGVKKPHHQPKEKPLPVLKLPTIHSASDRRTIWDSGQTHLSLKVASTHLEKNQVEEDCRNFRRWSKTIPTAADAKRTEIQRSVPTQQAGASCRVQFRRHPNPAPAPSAHTTVAPSIPPPAPAPAPAEANVSRQATTVDHFPKNQPRLPELEDDDGSSEEEEEEEEAGHPGSKEQARRTTLPAIPTAAASKPSDHSQPARLGVPPLRLQRGMTPSAASIGTMQSGTTGAATYMSQMSQDIREWKGAYMDTEDPYCKSRMLMEILHATRQRMQDNAEDLRLSGDLPGGPQAGWGADGRGSEVMLLHRDSTSHSGANTARSSVPQSQVFKLPRYTKKRAAGRKDSQNAKLHRYLHKLTNQRKAGGGEQPHPQRRAPFPLATMTIREITQTSLEHQSAVQTAS